MLTTAKAIDAFRRHSDEVATLDHHSERFHSPSKHIQDACEDLWNRRGKRLRPHLVFWFGHQFNVPLSVLETCAWAIEAVHTASLLHDDVIDNASLRRGIPSVNVRLGNRISVLSGDFLLSEAVCQVASLGHPSLVGSLCEAVKELSSGEALQHEIAYTIPKNWQTYQDIHRLKTSSLLKWAATVGPRFADPSQLIQVEEFMDCFGHLFQFTDDLIDCYGGGGKETLGDTKEGNINSVIWLVCQQNISLKERLAESLLHRSKDSCEWISAFLKPPEVRGMLKDKLEQIVNLTQASAWALGDSPLTQDLLSVTRMMAARTLL